MTTINLQVGAGIDDAHEADDSTSFAAASTTIGMTGSSTASARYNGGYRFTPVAMPSRVSVDAATLQLYIGGADVDDPNLDIHAEDEDSPGDFGNPADVTSRTRTGASVPWVATGIGTGWRTSPEVKTVIQEIIDRPGWVGDNSLVVLMDGKTTAGSFRSVSYDQDTIYGAKLDIDYTVVAGLVGRIASSRGIMRGVRRGVM